MLAGLRARNEWKFARRAAAGRPRARGRVVDAAASCAGSCRRPSRSRWASWSARSQRGEPLARAARARRRRLRRAPGADAAPPGGRRQPREPHRRLALRPAHARPACAAGHGPPREPRAHERSHHGARLRPRHQRAAALASRWTSSRASSSSCSAASPRRCVLAAYAWWAPLVLGGAWLATHWLLRESGVWRDRETEEVREAQRHADYAYRLAVDAPAAKELRLFGLAGWMVERFRARRRRLFELRWQATRLRERPVLVEPAASCSPRTRVVFGVARRRRGGRRARARPPRHLRERRGRHAA